MFEWFVPGHTAAPCLLECRAEFGMIVAPEHLVMTGGAVEKQPALFGHVEQAAADQEIIARPGLVATVRILEGALGHRLERRQTGDGLADLFEELGGGAGVQKAQASPHGGGDGRASRAEHVFQRERSFHSGDDGWRCSAGCPAWAAELEQMI